MRAIKSVITASLVAMTMLPQATLAQYPGGPGGSAQGPGGQTTHRPLARDRPAPDALPSIGAPVLVQLDQLENELKLTAEQRSAWNAYEDKILHLADDMTRSQFVARTAPQPTDATAAQQLDRLAESQRNRLTAVEEIVAAGKTFYAVLTTEQKAIADRKLVLPIRPLATGVSLPGIGDVGSRSGH